MKMSRPMTDLELIIDAIKQNGGFAHIEELLGKRPNVLRNEINENTATHKLGFSDWKRTMKLTGDVRSLHKVCNEFGGVFVPIQRLKGLSEEDWAKNLADYCKEHGDAMTALGSALSDDGVVDRSEAPRIEKEAWEATEISAAVALLCRKIIDRNDE